MKAIKGPAATFPPVNVFDVRLGAGVTGELTLPKDQNSAIVLLRGDVVLNGCYGPFVMNTEGTAASV